MLKTFPWRAAWVVGLALAAGRAGAADQPGEEGAVPPRFYRAINLAGQPLAIEGNAWEGDDAADFECADATFENQAVELVPPTDAERARMIRSSRWDPGGQNRLALTNVPPGTYSVFLYAWEDNDSQTFDVLLEGEIVAAGVVSGQAGTWQRLGPWVREVTDGAIDLACRGGHANFSGIEVWRGTVPGGDDAAETQRHPRTVSAAEQFDQVVAPLLARNCLECHNGSDKKGGLDLSGQAMAQAGGESGAALLPGQPEESLLWRRIAAGEMPPERPLPEADRQALRDWIAAGATWGQDPIDPFLFTSDRRAGYNWWSLEPPRPVEPPAVRDAAWPAGPIDAFVLARLEQSGLASAPPADRRTLIRRVTFDLTGLPPTPEEVAEFLADESADAWPRLVDRLLDSPHYGERWARHWLDVVRFGESQGFERNKLRQSAWRYRDWVVEAFNSDLPYDEFVRLQIAGDVLRPDDPLAVVASGFLVAGPYDQTAYTDGTQNMRRFAREEELEGLVGTVGQTFLGLTLHCARCHDHKFDPIKQTEYYRLAASLAGTYHGDEPESLSEAGRATAAGERDALAAQAEQLRREAVDAGTTTRRLALEAAASRLDSRRRLLEGGPAHVSRPQEPGVVHVLARGDFRQPQDPVTPGGIAALAGVSPQWDLASESPEADRRRALAHWIADPLNPLTARVIVNRLWAHHFGAGLVATPSDLGFQGGSPSHPELLDWLARQLVSSGPEEAWRLKRLHRLMLLSATYRQSSRLDPSAQAVDADNRLLWRFTPQRLEAEALRDAILAVSGDLDRSLGGPGYRDFTVHSAGNNENYTVFDAVGPEYNRRSLYRTVIRAGTSPLLDVLDCPDPSVATPRRGTTTTPLQALSLLNNPFLERQAEHFAARLQRDSTDAASQIDRAYELAFARPPAPRERQFAQTFIGQHGLAQFCLVLFNTSEFMYVD